MRKIVRQYSVVQLDENTRTSDLVSNLQCFVHKSRMGLGVVLSALCLYLFFANKTGASCFIAAAIPTFLCVSLWGIHGTGIPLLPMLAVQTLLVYGLPVLTGNETIMDYSEAYFTSASIELILFGLSLAGSWYAAMQVFNPAKPVSYTLSAVKRSGYSVFKNIGLACILTTTAFQIASIMGVTGILFDNLPKGSWPIVNSITTSAAMCGFFVFALGIGGGEISTHYKVLFWLSFALQVTVSSSSLLLSASTTNMASVAIGLFWSSGRIPWRFLVVMISILSFLNLGKHDMRDQRWDPIYGEMQANTIEAMPELYGEWIQMSFEALTGSQERQEIKGKPQTLAGRVNNLNNLLFVIDAVETKKTPVLEGATYFLIPPLLIPRFFWEDKPRAHEGQVMLNVHFGRQAKESTYKTYIAWGLLAEAYGNFGPYFGTLILGCALGSFVAWLERWTQNKAVFSMEGFCMLAVFMQLSLSYEYVASVLVTSMFQAVMTIAMAIVPFVERTTIKKNPTA